MKIFEKKFNKDSYFLNKKILKSENPNSFYFQLERIFILKKSQAIQRGMAQKSRRLSQKSRNKQKMRERIKD